MWTWPLPRTSPRSSSAWVETSALEFVCEILCEMKLMNLLLPYSREEQKGQAVTLGYLCNYATKSF